MKYTEYHMPKWQYLDGKILKTWAFLHHTAGWESPKQTIDGWALDARGTVATEFVLGGLSSKNGNNINDGLMMQAFPSGGYAWHLTLGNTQMHRESIGLEVCNFGPLTKGGYYKWNAQTKKNVWIALQAETFYTYVGTPVIASQVVELEKAFRGFKYFHKYSDLQIEGMRQFLWHSVEHECVDIRKGLPELIKKIGPFEAFDLCDVALCEKERGTWCHTNVQKGKIDLFPQAEVVEMLLNL